MMFRCLIAVMVCLLAGLYEAGDTFIFGKAVKGIQAERESKSSEPDDGYDGSGVWYKSKKKQVSEDDTDKETLQKVNEFLKKHPELLRSQPRRGRTTLEIVGPFGSVNHPVPGLYGAAFDLDGHRFIATTAGGLLHSPSCECQEK